MRVETGHTSSAEAVVRQLAASRERLLAALDTHAHDNELTDGDVSHISRAKAPSSEGAATLPSSARASLSDELGGLLLRSWWSKSPASEVLKHAELLLAQRAQRSPWAYLACGAAIGAAMAVARPWRFSLLHKLATGAAVTAGTVAVEHVIQHLKSDHQ
jgi:hypothetical protein